MRTKFIHLRDYRNGHISSNGGATIAFRLHGLDDQSPPNTLEWAFSECHWRDNFCRKLGRVKAEGKLNSEKHRQVFTGDVSQLNLQDFLRDNYYAYKSQWVYNIRETRR